MADFVKWLTSLSTLILGGAGFSLTQKVSGWLVWLYIFGIIAQLISICAGGLAFASVITLVGDKEESGKRDDLLANQMASCVLWQMGTFFLGLLAFLLLIIMIALAGKLAGTTV